VRLRAFVALLALSMVCGCASFGKWTPDAKSFVDGIWDAAKMLCLLANAEKAGTTVEDVADKCCRTQQEIAPWFDAAKAGARAGAVKAGMVEPLTPGSAEPELKAVPELEQRK
jgi:hypothetical protein